MLEVRAVTLPFFKLAAFFIANSPRQLDGFGEIHAHFLRRVGVGTERDRHAFLNRKLENFAAEINLPAIFAQPGGVEVFAS